MCSTDGAVVSDRVNGDLSHEKKQDNQLGSQAEATVVTNVDQQEASITGNITPVQSVVREIPISTEGGEDKTTVSAKQSVSALASPKTKDSVEPMQEDSPPQKNVFIIPGLDPDLVFGSGAKLDDVTKDKAESDGKDNKSETRTVTDEPMDTQTSSSEPHVASPDRSKPWGGDSIPREKSPAASPNASQSVNEEDAQAGNTSNSPSGEEDTNEFELLDVSIAFIL